MNWKEQFDKQYPHPLLPVTSTEHAEAVKIQQDALDEYYRLLSPSVKAFISTEIIEKLIKDSVRQAIENDSIYGFNDKSFEQQLRDKWL
jgi:hypothetical protein